MHTHTHTHTYLSISYNKSVFDFLSIGRSFRIEKYMEYKLWFICFILFTIKLDRTFVCDANHIPDNLVLFTNR